MNSFFFRLIIFFERIFSIGNTLEIAAQCAITMGDIPSFERALAQLKSFYFDLEYVFKKFKILCFLF